MVLYLNSFRLYNKQGQFQVNEIDGLVESQISNHSIEEENLKVKK